MRMRMKRLLSVLLSLAMVLSLMSTMAWATETEPEATDTEEVTEAVDPNHEEETAEAEDSTEAEETTEAPTEPEELSDTEVEEAVTEESMNTLSGNPIRISTPDDIIELRNNFANYKDKNIELENDIDCTNITWSVIGGGDGFYNQLWYDGTFDGKGHTITYNLSDSNASSGLFCHLNSSGTIKNLRVEGTVTCAEGGGIIMCQSWGTIDNCVNAQTVTVHDRIYGGIVGYLYGGTISNCAFTGSITSAATKVRQCGGIAGIGDNSEGVTMENCTCLGSISCEASASQYWDSFGVLCGDVRNNVSITSCYYLPSYNNSTAVLSNNATEITSEEQLGQLKAAALSAGKNVYGNALVASFGPPHTHETGTPGAGINFTAWDGTGDTLSAGNYYLTADVSRDSTLTISGTVNLCLNGHGIKYTGNSGSVIFVSQDATLNLYDCGITEHKYTINDDGLAEVNDEATGEGVKTFTGGYITGGNAPTEGGGVKNYGVLTVNGGTIIGNTSQGNGGGIFNFSNCSLTINGGAIIGNRASNQGGGIQSDGVLTINGGSITENTASTVGGGVYTTCIVNLSGAPVITGNTVGTQQNNLMLYAGGGNAYVSITGALSDGASIGVSRMKSESSSFVTDPGVFTDSTGNGVLKASDYAGKFTSDNTAYPIVVEGNELKLIEPHTVTVSGGANAQSSGGALKQENLTGAMTNVVYTANTDYYFAPFDPVTTTGITVTRSDEYTVTVSGTPTADTNITVPAAVIQPTSDYTLVIPATLNVQSAGWNGTDGITVNNTKNNFDTSKQLTVTATSNNSWALKSGDNAIGYTLATSKDDTAPTTEWSFSAAELNSENGKTAPMGIIVDDYTGKPGGTYTDIVVFKGEVKDAPSPLTALTADNATFSMDFTKSETSYSVTFSKQDGSFDCTAIEVNGSSVAVSQVTGGATWQIAIAGGGNGYGAAAAIDGENYVVWFRGNTDNGGFSGFMTAGIESGEYSSSITVTSIKVNGSEVLSQLTYVPLQGA